MREPYPSQPNSGIASKHTERATEPGDPFLQILEEVQDRLYQLLPRGERTDIAFLLHRLCLAHFHSVSTSLSALTDRSQRGFRQIETEEFLRLKQMEDEVDSPVPNVEQLAGHLLWMAEHSSETALDTLQRLKQITSGVPDELDGLREDAERAIIWRASAEPERWLYALRVAGPEEKLWLVTALIARVILAQGDNARPATGGSVNAPAKATISLVRQNALIELLRADDEALRAEVIYALGEAGGGEAVSTLAGIVRGQQPIRLRRHATAALGRIGGPVAVQVLMETYAPDEDERVSFYAINGLRNLLPTGDSESTQGVRQFLEALFEADDTPSIMREAARQALEPSAAR